MSKIKTTTEVTTLRKWKLALYKDTCKGEKLKLFLDTLPKYIEVDDVFDVKVIENDNDYIIKFSTMNSSKVNDLLITTLSNYARLETYFLNDNKVEETMRIVHLLKYCRIFSSTLAFSCPKQKLFLIGGINNE